MKPETISILASIDEKNISSKSYRTLLYPGGLQGWSGKRWSRRINVSSSEHLISVLLDVKPPPPRRWFEVLKFIREHSYDTQVIMLTGVHDVKDSKVECMQLGAYHYNYKAQLRHDELMQ